MAEPCNATPANDHPPLAWQGWHLHVPRDWNPARLTGTAREGSLIASDLERVRLEMNWKHVKARRGDRRGSLAWVDRTRSGSDWRADVALGEGIVDARRAVDIEGATLALLLSGPSKRLLSVRIPNESGGTMDPAADRVLASIADASGRERIPWCVYDFAWEVPGDYRLIEHQFTAGQMRAVFRRGRAVLRFERWVQPGTQDDPAPSSGSPDTATDGQAATSQGEPDPASTSIDHLGHRIDLAPCRHSTWWSRIGHGTAWQATWTCPAAQRRFRVTATGPQADHHLAGAVHGVRCHAESDPSGCGTGL